MRYLLLPVLLAGCVMTPEQQAQAIFNHYGPLCENVGYAKGTEKYGECVVRQYQTDVQAQQARSAQMGAMGMYLLNQSQPRPIATPNAITNTNCFNMGSYVRCTPQ